MKREVWRVILSAVVLSLTLGVLTPSPENTHKGYRCLQDIATAAAVAKFPISKSL